MEARSASPASNYREEHRKWYLGDSISAGIGQGYNAFTPLQLAHAIATIANDGVGYKPHLVKAIENTQHRRAARDRRASRRTRSRVKPRVHRGHQERAGRRATSEGTSAAAFVGAKYISAGKTGTAQVYSLKGEKYSEHKVDERLRDHALFIAFAPADKPKIALAVLVENGGFGAAAAAPIARKVFDYYLLGRSRAPAPRAGRSSAGASDDDESD